jgi:hypothetical protein
MERILEKDPSPPIPTTMFDFFKILFSDTEKLMIEWINDHSSDLTPPENLPKKPTERFLKASNFLTNVMNGNEPTIEGMVIQVANAYALATATSARLRKHSPVDIRQFLGAWESWMDSDYCEKGRFAKFGLMTELQKLIEALPEVIDVANTVYTDEYEMENWSDLRKELEEEVPSDSDIRDAKNTNLRIEFSKLAEAKLNRLKEIYSKQSSSN